PIKENQHLDAKLAKNTTRRSFRNTQGEQLRNISVPWYEFLPKQSRLFADLKAPRVAGRG
ncbi:MAG: hypothetical protein O3C34_11790, partial [Proteobacteria bacterium]|nr:hypothetical protein [Pseudomonadota bacterium]